MNSLSGDDLLKILQFLPGNDVTRFTRLNKGIQNFVLEHQSIFRKPTITLSVVPIGNSTEDFAFVVKTSKGSFHLRKDPSFGLQSWGENKLAEEFLDPFYEKIFDIRNYEPKLEQILDLIFSKVDIQTLQMNQYQTIQYMLGKVIKQTNCSVFTLQMDYQIRGEHRICPDFQEWLSDMCTFQQEKGVLIKLLLAPENFHNLVSGDVPKAYARMFSEVVVSYRPHFLYHLTEWALKNWKNDLGSENDVLFYRLLLPAGATITVEQRMETLRTVCYALELYEYCDAVDKKENEIVFVLKNPKDTKLWVKLIEARGTIVMTMGEMNP